MRVNFFIQKLPISKGKDPDYKKRMFKDKNTLFHIYVKVKITIVILLLKSVRKYTCNC